MLGFNSKLVRLKGARRARRARVCEMFQFQTGAIKSWERRSVVRLALRVSIPNWCD